jgi:very-short-patch-repair endonuclease
VAFHQQGLPAPELQYPLGDPDRPTAIVDFFWEEFGVVGEADGLLKYDDEEERLSLREEKLRQEAIEEMGFIVVRWTWDDIWRRPDWVERRLRNAFREGARRRAA